MSMGFDQVAFEQSRVGCGYCSLHSYMHTCICGHRIYRAHLQVALQLSGFMQVISRFWVTDGDRMWGSGRDIQGPDREGTDILVGRDSLVASFKILDRAAITHVAHTTAVPDSPFTKSGAIIWP